MAVATKTAAAFSVAMTSLYVAPELQAEILDITFNGGDDTAVNPANNGMAMPLLLNIDQVIQAEPDLGDNDFGQFNDSVGRSVDFAGSTLQGNNMISGLVSLTTVNNGEVISAAGFVGDAGGTFGNTGVFDGSGIAFIAFRDINDNIGWFMLDFTAGGAINYTAGQIATEGEALTIGEDSSGCDFDLGDVNHDGSVTLLDIGPFVSEIAKGGSKSCEADVNEDGIVDLLDIGPFVDLLTGN